jgi:thiosulfate/3-mercaptopyruvate sulfurtransferase
VIDPVVALEWVLGQSGRVVLADVRWYLDGRSGRAAYEKGHLPRAVFVDLDRWLAAPASAALGRHPLPEPAVFARGLAEAGIGDDDIVVAYDDAGGVTAARLVWMLRATGHEAALLDGGLAAYAGDLQTSNPEQTDGDLQAGHSRRTGKVFSARPWPQARLADADDAAGGSFVVLDARDGARFRGEVEPVDAQAGHIPGARNVPCRDNVDATGRFLPVPELQRRFAAAGVTDGADVVSYCGSGVTACHNLIAMEHAGLGVGRLYPGSWSQYSADPARSVATGD